MEGTLLHFAALLRAAGLRVSTGEVVDGMHAAAASSRASAGCGCPATSRPTPT